MDNILQNGNAQHISASTLGGLESKTISSREASQCPHVAGNGVPGACQRFGFSSLGSAAGAVHFNLHSVVKALSSLQALGDGCLIDHNGSFGQPCRGLLSIRHEKNHGDHLRGTTPPPHDRSHYTCPPGAVLASPTRVRQATSRPFCRKSLAPCTAASGPSGGFCAGLPILRFECVPHENMFSLAKLGGEQL